MGQQLQERISAKAISLINKIQIKNEGQLPKLDLVQLVDNSESNHITITIGGFLQQES